MPASKRKKTGLETNFDPPAILHDVGSAGTEDAGDLQGLSDEPESDSQSVQELADEGQAFEASVLSGIENADSSGVREVTTHEVPEDDVPGEYTDQDRDSPRD